MKNLAFRSSIWIEHLDGNHVFCLVFQVTNCETVVGSFSFLKEEQLVRPQVTVSALVVHPGPVVPRLSESNPVSQETRHPGVPRRRGPVHTDPAVLVVAHWSELLILWAGRWSFPCISCLYRFWFRFRVLLLIILLLIFNKVIFTLVIVLKVVQVAVILCSGAM